MKAEQRKEAGRRAAETMERKKASSQQPQIPGSLPIPLIHEGHATEEGRDTGISSSSPVPTEGTLALVQTTQTVPSLSFEPIQGGYEGPHTLSQPTEIRLEPHEPVSRSLQWHRPSLSAGAQSHAGSSLLRGEESLSRSPTQMPADNSTLTVRSEHHAMSLPTSSHTVQIRERQEEHPPSEPSIHSRQTRGSSTSSRHSDEIRKMAEAIRELQECNRELQVSNQVLHDELATVRSRRSSLASTGGRREGRMGLESRPGDSDTPLSKKWIEMDEIQQQKTSPRRILESVLQGKRRD